MTATLGIDVLVVGMGPAGARAAAEAAAEGASVLGIDRKKRPGFPVQCAEFVPAMIDQELSGLDQVTRQRIDEMITFVEEGAGELKPEFHGRMVDRAAFDRLLVGRAYAAGADIRFDIRPIKITGDGCIILETGETIAPKFIIGADGPRSRIGKAIGIRNTEVVESRQITVPLLKAHQATDIFVSADIPGGYGWLFPRGDVANIGAGVRAEDRLRLKEIVETLHARLVDEGRVGAEISACTGGAIPVGGMLHPAGKLGDVPVLLAGDAAGLANPVTGGGITSAVISGGLAGTAAADWIAGDTEVIDDYVVELSALFKGSLDHAYHRRRELIDVFEAGRAPTPDQLRQGWISYPAYWDERTLKSAEALAAA